MFYQCRTSGSILSSNRYKTFQFWIVEPTFENSYWTNVQYRRHPRQEFVRAPSVPLKVVVFYCLDFRNHTFNQSIHLVIDSHEVYNSIWIRSFVEAFDEVPFICFFIVNFTLIHLCTPLNTANDDNFPVSCSTISRFLDIWRPVSFSYWSVLRSYLSTSFRNSHSRPCHSIPLMK